eukprot:364089-Chlamydomonas_euryale.AAC.11
MCKGACPSEPFWLTSAPLFFCDLLRQVDQVRESQRRFSHPATTPQTATIRNLEEGAFRTPAATPQTSGRLPWEQMKRPQAPPRSSQL